MTRRDETPRDLLFGLLALQNGLIDQDQLVAAFGAWSRAKGKTLAEILLDRGAIDAESRSLLSAMAQKQLKLHGGDTEKSLASVGVGPATRLKLTEIGNADLTLSVATVRSHMTDQDATATMSIGSATSDGLRFRILRPHAQGGLGAVFVALDAELNREVALKEILGHHADNPTSRTRFLIEAEITGGLEHPGIVPVYGLGHYGDGRPYYAMRFIRGDSLKEAIASFHSDPSLKSDPGKKTLALRKLLRRFVDVCNAVDYAHGRGILHRDIKPANVIVGKHGETLVVDWGLAKPMGHSEVGSTTDERTLMPSSSSGSADTLPGSAMGTPAYMSPEQARGDLDRLGPRSDVYSLGATLYCLLIGKAPFDSTDVGAVFRDVQKGAFPPPRQLDPTIDRALEAVCLKAMALKAEDRHATARALADDVERWAADEPTSAWFEPASVRARRWMRRNRTLVTAAAATVLMAVIGLVVVIAVESRSNVALKAKNAELDKANGRVQARFELARDAIRAFQTGVNEDEMLKGENLKGLRDKLLKSAAGFYEKLETLLQGQADRPSRAILAQSYFELGELTEKIGTQTEALAVHRKALAIRRGLASSPDADAATKLDLARSLNAEGLLAQSTGDTARALSAFREARDLADPLATGQAATEAARAVLGASDHRIGRVLLVTGKSTEALASYREALAIRRKLAADNPAVTSFPFDLAMTCNTIGRLESQTGYPIEAMASYREALAIQRKLATENPAVTSFRSELAYNHHSIAELLEATGHPAEAMTEYREALAINQRLVAENPAVTSFRNDLGNEHNNIAVIFLVTDRSAEGLAPAREALAIFARLAAENPAVTSFRSDLANTHNLIGAMQSKIGHEAEAMAEYRESLKIYQRLVDDNPAVTLFRFKLAISRGGIGSHLWQTGHPAEALAEYREVLAINRKLVEDTPANTFYRSRLANSHCVVGFYLWKTGHPAEAMTESREALAISCKLDEDNPNNPDFRYIVAIQHIQIADILRSREQFDEARAGYGRAIAICEDLAKVNPTVARYRDRLASSMRGLGLVRASTGDLAGAVADARRGLAFYEGLPSRSGFEYFELACLHSTLSGLAGKEGSGISAGESGPEANRAMDLLREAIAKGNGDLGAMKIEAGLDPIRSRPDFQLLMMDLAFPAEPFAP